MKKILLLSHKNTTFKAQRYDFHVARHRFTILSYVFRIPSHMFILLSNQSALTCREHTKKAYTF